MPRKMYLDVDGVLVVWDHAHNCIELARGFGRLMRFCKLHEITPCWLTTWSKIPSTLDGLNCLLWPRACPTMAAPEIVPFGDDGKAATIDYTSDFVWIEDGVGDRDLAVLDRHGARDRLYWTDGLDPDCLLKFIEFTREKMKLPRIDDWGPNWDSFFTRPRRPPR